MPCTPYTFIQRDKEERIDRCSRRLVPQLQREGYDVRYREFPGFHYVPSNVVRESLHWFLAKDEQQK